MSRDPTTAATTSLKETVTLSSSGQRATRRHSNPPTRSPSKPGPRLRKTPKPWRSRVIISPAKLPPSRPMIIQTMNWSSETITALPRFGEAEAVGSVFEFSSPDPPRAGHNKPLFAPGAGPGGAPRRVHRQAGAGPSPISRFGACSALPDWGVMIAVRQSDWLIANVRVIGAAILAIAGVYQFTELKYRCLDKCRAPLGFVIVHWRGARQRRQALFLGVRHGAFCIGCCWCLMLLMFAVGSANIGWMLALGAAMAAEKNLPAGRRLAAPLGAVLLVAAGF